MHTAPSDRRSRCEADVDRVGERWGELRPMTFPLATGQVLKAAFDYVAASRWPNGFEWPSRQERQPMSVQQPDPDARSPTYATSGG